MATFTKQNHYRQMMNDKLQLSQLRHHKPSFPNPSLQTISGSCVEGLKIDLSMEQQRLRRSEDYTTSPLRSNLENLFVEKATISLVREYLFKKEFKSTLKCLHRETGAEGIADRRAPLAKALCLEPLLRENKVEGLQCGDGPLESMLEVVVKAFLYSRDIRLNKFDLNARSRATQTTSDTKEFKERVKVHKGSQSDVQLTLCNQPTLPAKAEGILEAITASPMAQPEVVPSSSPTSSISGESEPAEVSAWESEVVAPGASSMNSKPSVQSKEAKSTSPRSFCRSNSNSSSNPKSPVKDKDSQETDTPDCSDPHSQSDQDQASSSSSILEPLSPPSLRSFDNEFQVRKSNPKKNLNANSNIISNANEQPKPQPQPQPVALSLLESKQNILAHGCLTPQENKERHKVQNTLSLSLSQDNQKDHHHQSELCDIEDEDYEFPSKSCSHANSNNSNFNLIHIRNPSKRESRSQLELSSWRELKVAVMGTKGYLQDGWVGQGFTFNAEIPYALIQKQGGPCGVLAVVQSLLLRNMLFGCPSNQQPLLNHILTTKYLQKSALQNSPTGSYYSTIVSKRQEALGQALVEILWRCGSGIRVKICVKGEPGSEVILVEELDDLKDFVVKNLYQFDCLGLVYSAVLTRGVDKIQEDMDFPNSPLLGLHGYCSQELVNLLLFGKAISNVFDNQVQIDDKVLHGIKGQSDIGFLSLFEHYGSCEVGSFMKSPKYPIWMVCSESHFSVLFCPELDIVSRDKEHSVFKHGFDLYYYDGLARQQHIIRLTITFDQPYSKDNKEKEEDLVSPLEKCIRTKWKIAQVGWNGTEPLL